MDIRLDIWISDWNGIDCQWKKDYTLINSLEFKLNYK
jgi:hypothetical protein